VIKYFNTYNKDLILKKILLLFILTTYYLYANVGVISALSGKVIILRDNQENTAKLNDVVKEKDILKSIANSKAQIIFKDNTIVRIGKNSTLNIQKYLFDETTNSDIKLNMLSGMFRVITGKISKIAPNKFKLKTKNALIGIRGTIFAGYTTKEFDKIACLKGAITVESQGILKDVMAGEVIHVFAGKSPDGIKKYKASSQGLNSFSSKVDKNFKKLINKATDSIDIMTKDVINQTLKNEIYDQLDTIKNVNNKSASYNMYIDNSMEEAYSQLINNYTETYMQDFAINNYDNLFEDTYTPLSFTYFTEEIPLSNSISDILSAKPFHDWRHEENTPRTPESKIVEYMGGMNNQSSEIYQYWDGRSAGRKITIFEGNIIGIVTDRNDYVNNVSFIDPQENYVNMVVDFGNQFINTYLTFNAKDPVLGDMRNWKVGISTSGGLDVSSTGFYADYDDFYDLDEHPVFDSAHLVQGRFYGENLNQASAGFHVSMIDTAESLENYNVEDARYVFGTFAVNNVNEYDVNQVQVGEDDSFSWGYWDSEYVGTLGAWIKPKLQNTPHNVIANYIEQQKVFSYTGGVLGTYSTLMGNSGVKEIEGNFNFEVDFGANKMDGSIFMQTSEDAFNFNIMNAQLNENGIANSGEYLYNSTKDIKTMNFNAQFFGLEAQKIGGGIRFETTNGGIGLAAFAGTKVVDD